MPRVIRDVAMFGMLPGSASTRPRRPGRRYGAGFPGRGERPPGVAEDGGPERGDPCPGPVGRRAPGPGREAGRRDPDVPTDADHERVQGDPRGAGGGPVRHRAAAGSAAR
jgi:hypothetical protein